MRDLTRMVQTSDARGTLLHLNNLENLSESDAMRAAEYLRALRDIILLHNGVHYVLVGTADAVNMAVNTHAQVRSIVGTLVLAPFTIDEVHALLRARYDHLRVDPTTPTMSPVDANPAATLYDFFRGDLRGLLKALEDGVGVLIGLYHATAQPLTLDEPRSGLQQCPAVHGRIWRQTLCLARS